METTNQTLTCKCSRTVTLSPNSNEGITAKVESHTPLRADQLMKFTQPALKAFLLGVEEFKCPVCLSAQN